MPTVITRGAASAQGYGYAGVKKAVNYIEDVFSTYLYTGTGASQTITNGIDLSTKGGLVWIKRRDAAGNNNLADTARPGSSANSKMLFSNSTNEENTGGFVDYVSYNSTGFTANLVSGGGAITTSEWTFASWTFRKQAKFFDVVTYTGNGANRTIAHNLGSVPGCILIKRTDTTADWQVYHRSLANTEYMVLNTTAAKATGTTRWNSTTPTSTVFSLGTDTTVNANGGTYVAYLFAHDAGGFGAAGTDNVISCGSFTQSGSTVSVTLGYEPQFILAKQTGTTGAWFMYDTMRGLTVGTSDQYLQANAASAEATTDLFSPTSTGFTQSGGSLTSWIYIAIRRGPMKTPTSGTSVYENVAYSGDSTVQRQIGSSVLMDMTLISNRTAGAAGWSSYAHYVVDRLRGDNLILATSKTAAESSGWDSYFDLDKNAGWDTGSAGQNYLNLSGQTFVSQIFRRAPGFFDVVCYTGTGSNTTQTHNLGVMPEVILIKSRSGIRNWNYLTNFGATTYTAAVLNDTYAPGATPAAYDTLMQAQPTSTQFSISTSFGVNNSGEKYVAYLFATVAGVSKVGSYTGSGTTKQIDCGFTGGARFVLIKRTDSTGDWYVWDTARGIVSGNDPYLLLNSDAAEVTNTDYIDTYSAGFEISSTAPAAINANGGSFIFLAIA